MTLLQLQPGAKFSARDLAGQRGTLIKCNDCRALVRWERPPEYVHYTTAEGRTVEFYRTGEPVSVTPYLSVDPV